MTDRKQKTHYTFDTDCSPQSINLASFGDNRPRDGDTASAMDPEGRLFIWKFHHGSFRKLERWTETAANRCIRAADRVALVNPPEN